MSKDSILSDLLGKPSDPGDELAAARRKLDRLTTRAANLGTRERSKQATDPLYATLGGENSAKPRTTKDMLTDLARAIDTADTSGARDVLDEISALCDQIDQRRASSVNMGGGSGGNTSLTGDTPLATGKGLRTEPLFKGLNIRVRSK